MRVIAGKFKSRTLRAMPGMNTRPTSDRLRETLFNVLTAGNAATLERAVWLDLFAGTGAVGIEALSRGAQHATFVDSAKSAATVIRENLRSLSITQGFDVLEMELDKALRQLDSNHFTADYIFIDPPYACHDLYSEALNFFAHSSIVKPHSILMAEHDKRHDPGEIYGQLQRYRKLTQGDSALSFYRIL
jgi:16S rRNA (guanine966-N2)-methyltransferase